MTATELDTTALLERAVLAGVLAAPWSFSSVAKILGPEMFSDHANRTVYSTLLLMHSRGIPPDATLLLVELKDTKKMSAIRGPTVETVHQLLSMAVQPPHLEFYCTALAEKSAGRQKALDLLQSSNTIARAPE